MAKKISILKTSSFLFLMAIGTRGAAMVREMLLASQIGMNAYTDAFNVSQSAITFFTGILGATCVAIVPLLVSTRKKKGEEQADRLFTALLFWYMIISLVVAIFLTVFAEELMAVMGPGFSEETRLLAANLLRIGFIKINCVLAATLFGYYLQSKSIFIATGLSNFIAALITVGCLVVNQHATISDYTVYTVVGFAAQAIIPIPFILRSGYKIRLQIALRRDDIATMVKAALPLFVTLLLYETQMVLSRGLASMIGVGEVSSFDYANKLMQLVYGCVVVSLNTVLFTKISEHSSSDEGRREAIGYLLSGGRTQLLLVLPIIVLALFFGEPCVALIFQRGEFTAEDTHAVFIALIGFLFGCWGYMFNDLIVKYAIAQKQYKVIGFAYVGAYAISFALIYPLAMSMGVIGITLAFAISQNLIVTFFVIGLFRKEMPLIIRGLLGRPKDYLPLLAVVLLTWLARMLFGISSTVLSCAICVSMGLIYFIALRLLKVKLSVR